MWGFRAERSAAVETTTTSKQVLEAYHNSSSYHVHSLGVSYPQPVGLTKPNLTTHAYTALLQTDSSACRIHSAEPTRQKRFDKRVQTDRFGAKMEIRKRNDVSCRQLPFGGRCREAFQADRVRTARPRPGAIIGNSQIVPQNGRTGEPPKI